METASAPVAASTAAADRPDPGAVGARLSTLFSTHGRTVLGLCRVLLRDPHEAEDAVQQTFLSAYRSMLNGADPRHPAAWLATIARNECRGRTEQRMREPLPEPVEEAASPLPDPVAAAAASMDLAALWRAIGELPRRQRQAILLREFSGLSYGELAGALAVSEPAVESLLFRARRDLRLRLRPSYSSAAGIAPLAAIREALARVVGGMPDPAATGALAKIAAAPLLAKLAAGAAAVVVASGTVAAVEGTRPGRPQPATAGPAGAVTPAPRFRAVPVAAVVPVASATVAPRRTALRIHERLLPAASARVRPEAVVNGAPLSPPTPLPSTATAPATAGSGDPAPATVTGSTAEPSGMPAGGESTGSADPSAPPTGTTEPPSGGDGGGTAAGGPGDNEGGTAGSGESGDDTSSTPGTEDGGGSGSSGSDDGTEASGGSGSGSGDTGSGDTATGGTTEPGDSGSGDGGTTATGGDGGTTTTTSGGDGTDGGGEDGTGGDPATGADGSGGVVAAGVAG